MSATLRDALATHRPELLRHCYRMLGSFEDAEDLVQESLARAWTGRKSFAGRGPLRHWLYRIATHTCLNALKRKRRLAMPQLDHRAAPAGGALDEPLDPAHWVAPAPDDRLFARGAAEAAEEREGVAIAFVALLQRLPPRQRAVLLLKDVVGWPADENRRGARHFAAGGQQRPPPRAKDHGGGAVPRTGRRAAARSGARIHPLLGSPGSPRAGGALAQGRRLRHAPVAHLVPRPDRGAVVPADPALHGFLVVRP